MIDKIFYEKSLYKDLRALQESAIFLAFLERDSESLLYIDLFKKKTGSSFNFPLQAIMNLLNYSHISVFNTHSYDSF